MCISDDVLKALLKIEKQIAEISELEIGRVKFSGILSLQTVLVHSTFAVLCTIKEKRS